MSECVRGCVRARQHATDCNANTCPGCQPRHAGHGLLCTRCHKQLTEWLQNAPGQHTLLHTLLSPNLSQELKALIDAHDIDPSAPLNLEALTIALTLTDILSAWVEMLTTQHQLVGPDRLTTQATWLPWPRWSYYAEEVVWTDPPVLFEISSACIWLRAQIERLENCPGIGDLHNELGEIMGQAHALAPWREQVARLKGIECPECHHQALTQHGGDEHVTCEKCNAHITPGRYAIWTRMLNEKTPA